MVDKGKQQSFESCSRGAGRVMSCGKAKRRFSLENHLAATASVESRKDYRDIDTVM